MLNEKNLIVSYYSFNHKNNIYNSKTFYHNNNMIFIYFNVIYKYVYIYLSFKLIKTNNYLKKSKNAKRSGSSNNLKVYIDK